MRVLVAPDCFGGTLSATAAAAAIADGWRAGAPGSTVLTRPLADGGPGFVDVLHAALGGTVHETVVRGPLGAPVTARWLAHDDTAYLESAEAVGLHLVTDRAAACERASTHGVGELVAAARDAGLRTAVIGLGGSATTDGGAGLYAALGARPVDDAGRPLDPGGTALAACARLDGEPRLGGLRLVVAADVEHPLLGRHGAAETFGPQKGADPAAVARLETGLTRWADVLDVDPGLPGAGAAGGLGYALLALGAEQTSGAALVRARTGLDAALDGVDLVVTGEGSFDWQSLRGKLVTSVASAAAERGVPCVVLAGQVHVGRREMGAVGVTAAHAVAEHAGSAQASMADPAGTLRALAAEVGAQWR